MKPPLNSDFFPGVASKNELSAKYTYNGGN